LRRCKNTGLVHPLRLTAYSSSATLLSECRLRAYSGRSAQRERRRLAAALDGADLLSGIVGLTRHRSRSFRPTPLRQLSSNQITITLVPTLTRS